MQGEGGNERGGKAEADIKRELHIPLFLCGSLKIFSWGHIIERVYFMDLREWVTEYFMTYKRMVLKESTLSAYRYAIGHIPAGIAYDTLKSSDIQGIINTMIFSGLAWSTIMHTFTLISQALSHAQNYGFIDKSHLLKGVILPKKQKRHISAFSDSQKVLFLKNNTGYHAEHFEFLLLTGLRIGEFIGLQQQDIDAVHRILTVQRTYYRGKYQTPKTADSFRTIPLCGRSWEIVRKRVMLGHPTAPVFAGSTGKILDYRSMLDSFRKVLNFSGLSFSGIHVLRHTFATDLLRKGVSIKVISELLGHKDITVTCNVYSDVTLDMKADALQLLAN